MSAAIDCYHRFLSKEAKDPKLRHKALFLTPWSQWAQRFAVSDAASAAKSSAQERCTSDVPLARRWRGSARDLARTWREVGAQVRLGGSKIALRRERLDRDCAGFRLSHCGASRLPLMLANLMSTPASPEFFVGIGTLALINAGLAETKNRTRLGWFLLSLFIGPIATLLIVVLDRVEPSGPRRERRRDFQLEDFRQQ